MTEIKIGEFRPRPPHFSSAASSTTGRPHDLHAQGSTPQPYVAKQEDLFPEKPLPTTASKKDPEAASPDSSPPLTAPVEDRPMRHTLPSAHPSTPERAKKIKYKLLRPEDFFAQAAKKIYKEATSGADSKLSSRMGTTMEPGGDDSTRTSYSTSVEEVIGGKKGRLDYKLLKPPIPSAQSNLKPGEISDLPVRTQTDGHDNPFQLRKHGYKEYSVFDARRPPHTHDAMVIHTNLGVAAHPPHLLPKHTPPPPTPAKYPKHTTPAQPPNLLPEHTPAPTVKYPNLLPKSTKAPHSPKTTYPNLLPKHTVPTPQPLKMTTKKEGGNYGVLYKDVTDAVHFSNQVCSMHQSTHCCGISKVFKSISEVFLWRKPFL